MTANLRLDLPPVDCTDLLTRSDSEGESALTIGDFKDTFRQTQDSKPDKCTTWTNEKHNRYLRHLESSFIEQLQRSTGLSWWQSGHETDATTVSQKQLFANEQHASEKLTAIQDCSQKKLEFCRPVLKSEAEPFADKSCSAMASHQQEQSLVLIGKKRLGHKRIFSNASATCIDQIPVSLHIHDESVGSLEGDYDLAFLEFSDQNFAEDVLEKSSRSKSKRSKI